MTIEAITQNKRLTLRTKRRNIVIELDLIEGDLLEIVDIGENKETKTEKN